MTDTADAKLTTLPELFRDLMARPLRPLTRARLPDRAAVYVFYKDDEDRLLLELYAAHSLGLSVSHPRIKAGLTA